MISNRLSIDVDKKNVKKLQILFLKATKLAMNLYKKGNFTIKGLLIIIEWE